MLVPPYSTLTAYISTKEGRLNTEGRMCRNHRIKKLLSVASSNHMQYWTGTLILTTVRSGVLMFLNVSVVGSPTDIGPTSFFKSATAFVYCAASHI